jgi:hypothetical protein
MKWNTLTFHIGIALACWNNPIRMQQMFNSLATGYPGDPYALLQRQAKMAAQS